MLHGVEGRTPLASVDILKTIPLENINTKNLRKNLFKKILIKTNRSIKTISYKSGFGIKDNSLVLNYLKDKNIKDKTLAVFFGVNVVDEQFDLSKFVVNFRLYSLSVFLKLNNDKMS